MQALTKQATAGGQVEVVERGENDGRVSFVRGVRLSNGCCCYAMAPIDFWVGVNPVNEPMPIWLESAFKELGWEGDMRDGPYKGSLPPHPDQDDVSTREWWGLKQDNNGTTFIAAPYDIFGIFANR